MKNKSKIKSFPKHKTDKDAEHFVGSADLTEFDFTGFKPMQFEFANKSARINMRVPELLLERIKKIADKKHIPYTRYIRQILEAVVQNEPAVRSKK